jgi:hypothetical protein
LASLEEGLKYTKTAGPEVSPAEKSMPMKKALANIAKFVITSAGDGKDGSKATEGELW